jgi:hypothetical protein
MVVSKATREHADAFKQQLDSEHAASQPLRAWLGTQKPRNVIVWKLPEALFERKDGKVFRGKSASIEVAKMEAIRLEAENAAKREAEKEAERTAEREAKRAAEIDTEKTAEANAERKKAIDIMRHREFASLFMSIDPRVLQESCSRVLKHDPKSALAIICQEIKTHNLARPPDEDEEDEEDEDEDDETEKPMFM